MAITEKYVTRTAGGGGDGSPGNPWNLAEGFANATAGMRVNIQDDGTDYSVGATLAPSNSGTVGQPIIFRGYKTTITDGDQGRTSDNGALVTTNMPVLAFSSGSLNASANSFIIFESLVVTAATTVAAIRLGTACMAKQCSVSHDNNSSGSHGIQAGGSSIAFDCDISTVNATASGYGFSSTSTGAKVIGCRIKSVSNHGVHLGSGGASVVGNLIYECGGAGVFCAVAAASYHLIYGNTIVDCTSDAIGIDNLLADDPPAIINNHCTDNGGSFYDNGYSGVSNLGAFISHNRTRDNVSADNGLGDWPIYDAVTSGSGQSADYTAAGSDDYTLIAAAPGKAAGHLPFQDIGAFQREEPAGSGGLVRNPGMNGNVL